MFIFVVMNIHNKLREIGFNKTAFHKPNDLLAGNNMVLDNVVQKWSMKKDGSYGYIEISKIHPKSNSFWKLDFNEKYTIWISVVSNNINKIWLDDKEKKRLRFVREYSHEDYLKTIYTYSDIIKITSKKQIINLLPTDIKRDFIIKDLLK